MAADYYVSGRSEYGRDVMVPFEVFWRSKRSMDSRNQRLKLNRASVRADRCKGFGIEFRHLMQADFILFMRDALHDSDLPWRWWPETLLYVERYGGPFEVFARSRSRSYFNRARVLLGIENKETLQPLLDKFAANPSSLPRWSFVQPNPVIW